MANDFNGFEYFLVETEKGFNVLEQRDTYVQNIRTTHTEEITNGWVTFIRRPQINTSESLARIALTREGSLYKAYLTLKEEFKNENLIDKTSRNNDSWLEDHIQLILLVNDVPALYEER